MAVTIKDIAKVCDVSYSTVSRVLNGKSVRKNAQTQKIIDTAKALGYKPNTLAVQLVKRSSNMLGLMIPDIANPHYSEITKCVEDAALSAGYRVFLCNTDWDVRREVMYRDSLLESQVAGIIVMPVCDESHVMFRGLDIPVVLLGSRTMETEVNCAVMDNVRAGFMAAEYMIQLGRKRLCYIGRKVENFTSADRWKGFLQAAAQHGITQDKVKFAVSGSFGLKGGSVIKPYLQGPGAPDAIVAFNDFIAIGAMQAAEELGLIPGKDISILGFDDIIFSSLPKINLTTITPNNAELARLAVNMIKQYKEGSPGQSVVIKPHMVVRGTCGGQNVGLQTG